MQGLLKSLRNLGPLGSAAANAIQLATTNWVLTISAILGIWASFTDYVVGLVHNPQIQTGVGVSLVLLWTGMAIAYLYDRRRPRIVKSEPDYRYGLTFEGLYPALNTNREDRWFALGVQIRNFSQAPIRYNVERFDLRIGTRSLSASQSTRPLRGYLARGGGKISGLPSFHKNDLKEFFGKPAVGSAECSIIYGHPEQKPVRRLIIKMEINLEFRDDGEPPFGFGADILDEIDEPYIEPPPAIKGW